MTTTSPRPDDPEADHGAGLGRREDPTDTTAARLGHGVRERRERLAMDKKTLAAHAGINRNTLAALESGDGSGCSLTSVTKVERALAAAEAAAGLPPPAAGGTVELRLEGKPGTRDVVVRGPLSALPDLERSLLRLARELPNLPADHTDATPVRR